MVDDFNISGRKFLVTGAASGIGKEIVKSLISAGNEVFAVDKDDENLIILSSELKSNSLISFTADIRDSEMRRSILEKVFKLDGVVNCAGIIKLIPFRFINETLIRELDSNNYEAPLLLTSSLLKKGKISEGASIVFISSIMSTISTQTNALYTGTKAALAAVTKTIALEVAPQRIRVNSVSPGFVKTPMLELIGLQTNLEDAEANHPLGFGDPDDVAKAVYFLLSDASKWITGINLIIDGGYCAK